MLGWWGWAILAYPFFSDKMNRAGAWKWAGFLIALSTPLLFTTSWGGTDIFLWAAVPWVLTWVLKASTKDVLGGTRFDVMAGAVCGLAILMRYASVFLTVYAAFLILWQSRLRPYVLTRRSLFFAMGLVPFLAVQVYINEFLTSGPPNPGGLSFQFGFGAMVRRALEGLPLLTTANFLWAFWFPGIALDLLFSNISRTLPWQLAIILTSYVFLALSAKIYGINLNAAAHDSRVASMGLFIAFPFLLWACMMMGTYNYLGNQRYYWPLLPLGIFVVYSVASFAPDPKRTGLTRVVQAAGGIYIIGYVALSIFDIASFFGSGERGALERYRLIGSPPGLSLAIAHELSPARKFVVRHVKEEPDTLLLASSKTGWFVGDNALDRSRVHELSCRDNLKAPYVTGPARIIFLTYNEGKPLDLWGEIEYWQANSTRMQHVSSNCQDSLSCNCFQMKGSRFWRRVFRQVHVSNSCPDQENRTIEQVVNTTGITKAWVLSKLRENAEQGMKEGQRRYSWWRSGRPRILFDD